MRTIVYHGPGHVLYVDGKSIRRGKREQVKNATADRLRADSRVNVTVLDEDKTMKED